MALINSDVVPFTGGAYEIEQSLRFNDDDSAYLSKSFTTATDTKKWTWSGWVKRGNLTGSTQYLFSGYGGNNDSNYGVLYLEDTQDTLRFTGFNTSWRRTTQVFRDPSAWYHIVLSVDTTQATASDRITLYVNGEEVTDFSENNNPSQNSTVGINTAATHYLGADVYGGPLGFYDGYLAEVNFIDGQALDATYFGETGDYGEWKPIEYTGTYGTNGFYLDFSNEGNYMTATGGTITTDGDYKVHTFTSSGTFEVTQESTAGSEVEYLIVGGGAGGAGYGGDNVAGGGGGAGGMLTATGFSVSLGSYSIVIGAGGAAAGGYSGSGGAGGDGNNTTALGFTAYKGGSGGMNGANGGSGSYGSGGGAGGQGTPGSGTSGQGNSGGTGTGTYGGSTTSAGGGGGKGGSGGNSNGSSRAAGGAGAASSITGSTVTYASGGQGALHTDTTSTNGSANRGDGGSGFGGASGYSGSGGTGGSGVVIIRYKYQ